MTKRAAKAVRIRRAQRMAVGGRRPRCRKGKSCSAACINRNKECLVDMPAPVEGALVRAVREIKQRDRTTKSLERREQGQKRREYAKGRLEEGFRLKRERRDYFRERRDLVLEIQRTALGRKESGELREKLEKLESEKGSKLGIPKLNVPSDRSIINTMNRAGYEFSRTLSGLQESMRELAIGGNRTKYIEAENKYLKILNSPSMMWELPRVSASRNFEGKPYEKGAMWKFMRPEREDERSYRIKTVYNRLIVRAKNAALDNDRKEYNKAIDAALKIASKSKDRAGLWDVPKRESLWVKGKIPRVADRLDRAMEKSLMAGNLARYNELESRLIKLQNRLLADSRLGFGDIPFGLLEYEKGEKIRSFIVRKEGNLASLARKGDSKEYNKLEAILKKIDPELKTREIWKRQRLEVTISELNQKLKLYADTGDRRNYNRIEGIMLRMKETVDPSLLSRYSPLLELTKGGTWRERIRRGAEGKIRVVVDKLETNLLKAISDGDRAKYDKIEARLFRIAEKTGVSGRYISERRGIQRGEVWEGGRGQIDFVNRLEKGGIMQGREGVEGIKINSSNNFVSVESRVLGNVLDISVSPSSTSFTVNGSYTASEDLTRREKVAIIREVTRQYDEIVRSLREGTILSVTAAEGDNRELMREKAYTNYGFSEPTPNMYGKVKGGVIVPSDYQEYRSDARKYF